MPLFHVLVERIEKSGKLWFVEPLRGLQKEREQGFMDISHLSTQGILLNDLNDVSTDSCALAELSCGRYEIIGDFSVIRRHLDREEHFKHTMMMEDHTSAAMDNAPARTAT